MAEPSSNINYSFEDIQRYLNGGMSATEMHAIEKAALQDAFLADAIEGYTEVNLATAQKHLKEINAAINGKQQKSKVITFNKTSQWLTVAAIIIIIAGVALLGVYSLNTSNKKQSIAQAKKETSDNIQSSADSTTAMQSAAPEMKKEEPVIAQNKNKQKASTSKKKELPEASISANENVQEDKASTTSIMASAAPVQQNETAVRSFIHADENNDSVQKNLQGKVSGLSLLPANFSGKIVDENNKPITGATIESADKKSAVISDINGNFNLLKNDTLLNVTASSVSYVKTTANLKAGNNNSIILKQNDTALNDVVIVGYGAEKKRKPTASAMPVGGWTNFNNYATGQLNKDTIVSTNANDFVELEFLVDNSGNPYNIKIVKSLNEQRNLKAIEILKNGPKWTKPLKSNKTKLRINF